MMSTRYVAVPREVLTTVSQMEFDKNVIRVIFDEENGVYDIAFPERKVISTQVVQGSEGYDLLRVKV